MADGLCGAPTSRLGVLFLPGPHDHRDVSRICFGPRYLAQIFDPDIWPRYLAPVLLRSSPDFVLP
jgi:hypothetical protein